MSNEQREASLSLLRRLDRIEGWEFFPAPAVAVYETEFERYELAIGGDGKIFGGDALWSMLEQMQERWLHFQGNRKVRWTDSAEGRELQWFVSNAHVTRLDPEYLVRGYITWKEAVWAALNDKEEVRDGK